MEVCGVRALQAEEAAIADPNPDREGCLMYSRQNKGRTQEGADKVSKTTEGWILQGLRGQGKEFGFNISEVGNH